MAVLTDVLIVTLPSGEDAFVYRMYGPDGVEVEDWANASHLIALTDPGGTFVGIPAAEVTLSE